jgi:chaperonin cofactor prefoldin
MSDEQKRTDKIKSASDLIDDNGHGGMAGNIKYYDFPLLSIESDYSQLIDENSFNLMNYYYNLPNPDNLTYVFFFGLGVKTRVGTGPPGSSDFGVSGTHGQNPRFVFSIINVKTKKIDPPTDLNQLNVKKFTQEEYDNLTLDFQKVKKEFDDISSKIKQINERKQEIKDKLDELNKPYNDDYGNMQHVVIPDKLKNERSSLNRKYMGLINILNPIRQKYFKAMSELEDYKENLDNMQNQQGGKPITMDDILN